MTLGWLSATILLPLILVYLGAAAIACLLFSADKLSSGSRNQTSAQ